MTPECVSTTIGPVTYIIYVSLALFVTVGLLALTCCIIKVAWSFIREWKP